MATKCSAAETRASGHIMAPSASRRGIQTQTFTTNGRCSSSVGTLRRRKPSGEEKLTSPGGLLGSGILPASGAGGAAPWRVKQGQEGLQSLSHGWLQRTGDRSQEVVSPAKRGA